MRIWLSFHCIRFSRPFYFYFVHFPSYFLDLITNKMLMPIFANPFPKAHKEEKPIKIKAQRPTKKTEKQERSKERIQICRRSIAKRRSTANYKFATEYRSATKYSSSANKDKIGPNTLLIQSILFSPQRPKSFCIKR